MSRIFPKRGYLMLLVGIILGMGIFAFLSAYYYSIKRSSSATAKMPKYIEITFLYSSEKQRWIEEVTPLFEKWFNEKYGVTVKVNLVPAGSHESVDLILHGSIKPTCWSPASSLWINYLNKKWIELHGGEPIAEKGVPLVISPIVIVGWENIVRKYNITNFRDLYRLAKEGINFKWGHTDPSLSNSGLMAVILEFAEGANKSPDQLSTKDLTDLKVKEFVKTIESHAVKYGKSTGFFGAWATESGPKAIDFFVAYENIVIDFALKAERKWGQRLIAIYPSSGTLLSDHPFVILNAKWVTVWQRFVALEYLHFLLRPDIQEIAEKHGFRPANPSVPLRSDIFNEKNGVCYKLNVKILKPPKGEVIEVIFTVWAEVMKKGV